VEVEPSPIFQREGYDVVVPRSIDFTDAILGGTIRRACMHGQF
jgi:DnaJ-class molecular chaperone